MSMDTFKEKIDGNRSQVTSEEVVESAQKNLFLSEELPTLKEMEQILIEEALKRAQDNQTIPHHRDQRTEAGLTSDHASRSFFHDCNVANNG